MIEATVESQELAPPIAAPPISATSSAGLQRVHMMPGRRRQFGRSTTAARARAAALAPHIPWAPAPGGVDAEHR